MPGIRSAHQPLARHSGGGLGTVGQSGPAPARILNPGRATRVATAVLSRATRTDDEDARYALSARRTLIRETRAMVSKSASTWSTVSPHASAVAATRRSTTD